MKDKLTSQSLLLTGLNIGQSFSLRYSGRTSFQPIGTVTGTVKLQFSNDNVSFFDLETGLDVSQPFVIETTDYNFYRFVVTTIGIGTVKWSIANSDTVQDNITVSGGGGSGGVTSFNTRTGDVTANTNDYNASQIENVPSGDITSNNVQGAINQLDSKINDNSGLIIGKSNFLTTTQATTSNSPIVLGTNTFIIPAGKKANIRSIIIFTSAATTTGLNHSIRVSNPSGANADVIGRTYSGVNLTTSASSGALNDGDNYVVTANTNVIRSVIGTASTAGNIASIRFADIYNQSTTTDAIVTIEFASEVNGSAVTAQIGSGATCIIF